MLKQKDTSFQSKYLSKLSRTQALLSPFYFSLCFSAASWQNLSLLTFHLLREFLLCQIVFKSPPDLLESNGVGLASQFRCYLSKLHRIIILDLKIPMLTQSPSMRRTPTLAAMERHLHAEGRQYRRAVRQQQPDFSDSTKRSYKNTMGEEQTHGVGSKLVISKYSLFSINRDITYTCAYSLPSHTLPLCICNYDATKQ